jgi:uncharacterized membrane protein
MMTYLLIKWVHILAAIAALGANITYGVWIARSSRSPETLSFTLRTIKMIDDRLANPGYGILLITGLLMVYIVRMQLTTPWLLTALVIYVIVVMVGIFGYTPALRKQIAAFESEGFQSAAYQEAARRSTILGIVTVLLVVVIVFLMVVKPSLWA